MLTAFRAGRRVTAKFPHASDGKPDLSGVWLMVTEGESARQYVVPGQLAPFQPGGEARFNAKHDAKDDPSGLKCLPFGVPRQNFAPYAMQVVQTPGQVVIPLRVRAYVSRDSDTGGEHSKKPDPTWNGESVAKWDGDTLVIDTIGLNENTWMDAPATCTATRCTWWNATGASARRPSRPHSRSTIRRYSRSRGQ